MFLSDQVWAWTSYQVHSVSYCCVLEAVKGHRQHKRGSNELVQQCTKKSAWSGRRSNSGSGISVTSVDWNPASDGPTAWRRRVTAVERVTGSNSADRAATSTGDCWWETDQTLRKSWFWVSGRDVDRKISPHFGGGRESARQWSVDRISDEYRRHSKWRTSERRFRGKSPRDEKLTWCVEQTHQRCSRLKAQR